MLHDFKNVQFDQNIYTEQRENQEKKEFSKTSNEKSGVLFGLQNQRSRANILWLYYCNVMQLS